MSVCEYMIITHIGRYTVGDKGEQGNKVIKITKMNEFRAENMRHLQLSFERIYREVTGHCSIFFLNYLRIFEIHAFS